MRGGVILQGLVCYRDTGEKNGARMLCGVRFDAAYASRGEGMLAALSAKRAAKYLQKRRVSYAVFPKDYPYAEVFARCGVLPPPEKPLRMAKAAEIIRRAMARLGLAPERARIALCAPSQSAALEAAARELSKDVRYLALCAPNGERLARTLRWDCGASVHTLQTDERIAADLSVCFDDFPLPDGLVLPLGSGAVSVAYGTENLGTLRLACAPRGRNLGKRCENAARWGRKRKLTLTTRGKITIIISLKWYSCARRAILRARKKGTISIWRT